MIVQSYLLYLVITLTVTIWVAHTLHRNGRVFLLDAVHARVVPPPVRSNERTAVV